MKNRSLFKSREFSIASMLSALTVVLSFLEGMLPELPVPGAKLGLANLAVMTAIDILGIKGAVCTVLVKSFLDELVSKWLLLQKVSFDSIDTIHPFIVVEFDHFP